MVLQTLAGIGGGLRRTLSDTSPAIDRNPFQLSRGYFALLRSYYENTCYEDATLWQAYKARYRMARSTRSVFNPTRRAVDWFSGRVYQGGWTEDGKPLPDGTPHVLQFPPDVIEQRPALVLAALQSLNWGNWQAMRTVYVREAAILGTAFVEIVDDDHCPRRRSAPARRRGPAGPDARGPVQHPLAGRTDRVAGACAGRGIACRQ